MQDLNSPVPRFVSIVAIALGCFDLFRGFMHTIVLEYAALNIAGLDLTLANAFDQLQLMAVFGGSNYITGAALIYLGWHSRKGAHFLLGIVLLAYAVLIVSLRYHGSGYAPSQANWGGARPMMIYLTICAITWIGGWIVRLRK